ncbi:FkbM family methyltransferase/HAD superfamily phosphatase (TIGR01681 family)/FkbH-like protein/amino acid adenylation domain-containing protein, partial [Chitinophaga japonensis]
YEELDRLSDRVAEYLRRDHGVVEGDLVGLMLERSERLIICLLGILKSGGAYVPIDPSYPASRIRYMLEDSSPRVVLTERMAMAALAGGNAGDPLPVLGGGQSLAYVIYTSGSTGQPKGVMVPHVAVVRLVHDPNYVTFSTEDKLLQTGSISFDASTFEIWGMLLNGGTLYLLDHDQLMDTEILKDTVQRNGISMMWFSASWFNQLVDNDPSLFKGLKQILVGGDKLSPRHINLLRSLYPDLSIINGYGPTENTTFSICYHIRETQTTAIPLGRPVTGTKVFILDKQLQPVPVGCYGEIYLSGDGLAHGYLHMDDKNRERFIAHPFEPGRRMYRTGDIGRWNWKGEVEFAGRADDQVKIRGFRIEPGEITAAILQCAQVRDAVVVPFTTPAGEKELAAYIVWEAQEEEGVLRSWLREQLPEYMQPGYYVTLAQLPLNANGKVDREALPAPRSVSATNTIHAPRDEREAKLLAIWRTILQREDIGIRDNFFEKGGHSLRASNLLTSIHKELGVKVPLKTLFRHNTIEALSGIIAAADTVAFEALEKVAEQPYYEVSHAQKRLWILDQMESDSGAYNIPGAYVIKGRPDKDILENALNLLVARHESLRTRIVKIDGEPKQQVLAANEVKARIAYHDLTSDEEKDATARKLLNACMHDPFSLHTWPLFRAMLIRMEAEQYIFMFSIHHIVSDGWSQGVIGREISVIYNAMVAEQPPHLPALPVQYKDYTGWHNRLLRGALGEEAGKYWSARFRKPVPCLNMPADRLRPRLQTFDGDVVTLKFDAAVTEHLQRFSQEREATLFMSLLALVNTLLYCYTGVDDIVIASPIAAREHADLHGQIGFFANTLALRTHFSENQTFESLLQTVKETTLKAYQYQMYPYDRVIEDAAQQYDPSHAALSDVMLVLQSNEAVALDLPGMQAVPLELSTNTARFDLVFIFTVEDGALCLDLGFNTNIYDRKRIAALAETLQTLIHRMLMQPALTVKALSTLETGWNDVADKGVPLAVLNGHLVYAPEINAALEALPGIEAGCTQLSDNKTLDVFIVPESRTAHTVRQLLKMELEPAAASHQVYTMPNGLPVCYKNKTETDFTYKEVFEQHAYLKNGITLRPGDVIFDVGANIGMFSLYAGYHFPGCRVFAFEPIPPVYNCLAANAALYDMDIVPLNIGLSGEESTAEFVYYPNNTIISGRFGNAAEDKEVVKRYLQNKLDSEGSTMSEKHMEEILEDMIRSEKWECRLSTVSAVMQEWNVSHIDLLKIDVEKSEWDILQGIAAADWQRIRQVIVEVHDIDGRLEQVKHLLEQQGYDVHVEQEEELAGTALYNIYAVNSREQPALVATAPIETGWTDIAACHAHISNLVHNRLPAYLGAVNVYLADMLPIDEAGNTDQEKINRIKASSAPVQGTAAASRAALQVVVAATFTADPLSDYINWWTDRFNIPVQVKQAPYNQVFQELLQEDSMFSGNRDINLLLVRWEDLIRDVQGTEETQLQLVEQSFQQLVSIMTAREQQALCLVGIIPPAPAACSSRQMLLALERINQQWIATLQQLDNVRVLDFTGIAADFNIAEIYDPQRDKLGHIPFHEEVYAAMATMVARQIRAYKQPSFKLIVLDCDNTLWSGVVGEDGVSGIRLLPQHLYLQRFMLQKKQEGFLLALCSKNNEADVWEVFEQHPEMILRQDDFVTWRINWNDKAVNLAEMAAALNIGINTCCLIDDSPVECAAVAAACPDVLVLQLPERTEVIPQWLKHVWAFDKFTVTEEDQERTTMYKAEQERKQVLAAQPSLGDFLAQLQLQVSVQDIQDADISRVAQLTERTNQFNLNGIRKTEQEIKRYVNDRNYYCKTIRVRDRFGDYGLTGVLITSVRENALQVEAFLLSCRVLGRQVEQSMLGVLKEQAASAGLDKIVAGFVNTSRNKPFLQFLEGTSWTPVQTADALTIYEIRTEDIPDGLSVQATALQLRSTPDPVEPERPKLLFDHIGVAVSKPDEALAFYRDSGFAEPEHVYDPVQNVQIYMCRTASGGGIELIAPHDDRSPVNNIISSNGDQPYHFCYRVKQLDLLFDWLRQEGIAFEMVKEPEPAVLFDDKRVVFLNIPQAGLVEFIEDSDTTALPPRQLPEEVEVSLVTFDVQPALQFFRLVGYREIRHVTDHVNKEYTVVLHARHNGPVIRLILPVQDAGSEGALFLQRNGPHIFRLLLQGSMAARYAHEQLPSYFTLAAESIRERTPALDWDLGQELNKNARHYPLYLPLLYNSGEKLLQIPVYQVQQHRKHTALHPPETATEKALFNIWEAVLRHQSFGVHTSFLEAGGNSIKATQVLSRIYRQYGIELLLTAFFNKPTIRALASLIEKEQPEGFQSITPLPPQDDYPLSFSQKQLWISDQFENGSGAAFNIPVAYMVQGALDMAAMNQAFSSLVERHEILRTVFVKAEDEVRQRVLPADACAIVPEWIDMTALTDAEAAALQIANQEPVLPFNLETGPLLRIKILRLAPDRHLLLFTTHHIVSDGWSSGIMLREIAALYNACHRGKNLSLPALRIQYKDYAGWQQRQMQQPAFKAHRRYWLQQFQEGAPVLRLPCDFPRPAFKSYNGSTRSFLLDSTAAAEIKTFIAQQEVSLFMFFVTVTKLLLYRLSGQQELVVGFPVSGRQHPELEDQVGCYVNTIALHTKMDTRLQLADFVQLVKQNITHAYAHAAYPFEQLVEELGGHTDMGRSPLFDVMVQMQDAHLVHQQGAGSLDGLKISMTEQHLTFSKYDLTVNVMETPGGIAIDLEYNTDLFKPETIAGIQADLTRLINLLVASPALTISEVRVLLTGNTGNAMQQYQQAITASIDESF